jgi:hypothetical protein
LELLDHPLAPADPVVEIIRGDPVAAVRELKRRRQGQLAFQPFRSS